jgi:hypothetical protein
MDYRIPLSEVLQNIAEELIQAQNRAIERGIAVMQFAECEAEFAVKADYEGGGKVKIYVAELGSEIKKSESNVVRIKFTAIPGVAPMVAPATVEGRAPDVVYQHADKPAGTKKEKP